MTVSYESPARPSEATYHQLDTKQARKQCTLEEALPLKQNHDSLNPGLHQELEELCLTCMCVHMNTYELVRGLHRQAGKHERACVRAHISE